MISDIYLHAFTVSGMFCVVDYGDVFLARWQSSSQRPKTDWVPTERGPFGASSDVNMCEVSDIWPFRAFLPCASMKSVCHCDMIWPFGAPMDIGLSDCTYCMKFKCQRCEHLPVALLFTLTVWSLPAISVCLTSLITVWGLDRLEPCHLVFTRVEPPAISPCLTSLCHCVCCHCSTWRNSQHGIYYKLYDIGRYRIQLHDIGYPEQHINHQIMTQDILSGEAR